MRLLQLFVIFGAIQPLVYAQPGIEHAGRIIGRYHGAGTCVAELHDQQDGRTIADAPCAMDGSFQFNGLPQGTYLVTTRVANKTYKRQVDVFAPLNQVDVYADSDSPPKSGVSTVSIQELKIPDKAKKDVEKAKQLLNKSDYRGATARLSDALTVAPQYPDALALQAAVYLLQRDFTNAARLSEQAIEIDPNSSLAQLTKASAFNSLGHPNEAALAANQAIRLHGSSWQAHFELGRSFALQGNLKSALTELNTASSQAPKDFAELYFVRAFVLAHMNIKEAARADADKFAALSSNDPRLPRLNSLLKK